MQSEPVFPTCVWRRAGSAFLLISLWLFASAAALRASTILSIIPNSPSVPFGQTAGASVTISGLGNQQPPSLGTFDLQFWFDPGILSTPAISFGDPTIGDQLALQFAGLTCAGAVPSCSFITPTQPFAGGASFEVEELSLDDPAVLDSTQPGAFTLFTINFQTLHAGASPLALSDITLSDAGGNLLTPDLVNGGTLTVTSGSSIPEPGAGWLALSGICAFLAWRRFRSKITG